RESVSTGPRGDECDQRPARASWRSRHLAFGHSHTLTSRTVMASASWRLSSAREWAQGRPTASLLLLPQFLEQALDAKMGRGQLVDEHALRSCPLRRVGKQLVDPPDLCNQRRPVQWRLDCHVVPVKVGKDCATNAPDP